MAKETSMVTISRGISKDLLLEAAELYYQHRLSRFPGMLPRDVTVASISERLDPDYALSASGSDGSLFGIATFAQKERGFWRPDPNRPEKTIGFSRLMKNFVTGVATPMPARARWKTSLLLEGVFVNATGLERGVGEPLLDGVIAEAKRLGMARLDVIVREPNPPVKAVYERHGFRNRNPRAQYGLSRAPSFPPAFAARYTHMTLDLVR